MQQVFTRNNSQNTENWEMLPRSEQKNYPTLTSWLEGSHVKHFLLQEREEGLMTQEEHCFLKSQGFSKTNNQNIFYSKMLKVYYLTTKDALSRQYLKSSINWGIMLNGRYIIPKTMEFHKGERESVH